MLISMHGNWTISVKAKHAAYPQRYVIAGAATGNGSHDVTATSAPVQVTGTQWSIAILNNPGNGFRLSDTRIKFPTISGNNFVFDIESNDAGSDQDYNDLVLTCSSPASITDYMLYGNVSLYSNSCLFNPCIRRWVVIDTYKKYLEALKIDKLRDAIELLYPERVPPVGPNPPDPPPYFTPMMINLADEAQLPQKMADVFRRSSAETMATGKKAAAKENVNRLSNFNYEKTILASSASSVAASSQVSKYNKVALAKITDSLRLRCSTNPGVNLTLNFSEYDRNAAELAGGAYTGTGDRINLGYAITDRNGNYIFRFTQSFGELVTEIDDDVAAGENVLVQARPDIVVSVADSLHPSTSVHETAPYFNVPKMKRIDFCLPAEKVQPTSLCFNGNLLGSLGNVFIGGNQNTLGSLASAALSRSGYSNHLSAAGKITVHNAMAGFGVDCACWGGLIDVKGCMYNLQRKKNDPLVRHYTIRYKKPGADWQFVNQTYLHPKFSKRHIPFYHGDLVGPFSTPLKVDGAAAQSVPAYKNIQAEVFFDGIDWEFSNLDRYAQLNSAIYEAGNPGRVYFMIEGYDANGNLVPGAKDLIVLFINNRPLEYGIGNIAFVGSPEKIPCGLYKLLPSEMNLPLQVQFKAHDAWGFTDFYELTIGKCPQQIEVEVTNPLSIAGTKSAGVLASGSNALNTDAQNCMGYYGTIGDFGTVGYVTVTLHPSAAEGGWLRAGEQFGVISFKLDTAIRRTNGYNNGVASPAAVGRAIYLQPK